MNGKLRSLGWLLVLVWMLPTLAFADRRAQVIGKIVDTDNKPLQGVTVTVTSPQLPSFKEVVLTDKKGVFTIDYREINVTYHYQFDKTGYATLVIDQNWTLEGSQVFQWTMQPATVQVTPGGGAPASTSAPAIDSFNAGLEALKTKDKVTAEAKFQQAVGHDANFRQAWSALAGVELDLGKNKEAAAAAEKAIALGSTDEPVYLARWQAYKNLKDEVKTAEALKDLERIGKSTEEAKRIYNEAVGLVKAGDSNTAYTRFKDALAVDPNLTVAQVGLATAAFKTGHNSEAYDAAESILKGDAKNEAAIRLRYNAALGLGDKEKLYTALLGLAPYEPKVARDGVLRLAFDAYDANNLTLAEKRFDKVVELDPTYAQAHYYLGVIDAGKGASAKAREHIEKFLQMAPNDPEAKDAKEMLKYLK